MSLWYKAVLHWQLASGLEEERNLNKLSQPQGKVKMRRGYVKLDEYLAVVFAQMLSAT